MKRIFALIIALIFISLPAFSEDAAPATMLSADGAHILALDSDGNVWAWGSNHRGESVPGKADERIFTPEIVFKKAAFVSAGQQFSMAIDDKGSLYAWGDNREKQIFASANETVASPVLLMENVVHSDACDTLAACVTQSGECWFWGGGMEKTLISDNAIKCEAGMNFALVLTKDGKVYEYTGGESKLMLENAKDISAFGESRYAYRKDGTLFAWGAAASDGRLAISGATRFVTAPEAIFHTSEIASLHAGLTLSGFLTNESELYLWGTLYSYMTAFDEAGSAQAALVDGALLSYGHEPIRLYENVQDAAFGDAFIALLLKSGEVITWGSNDQGQIGNGSFTQVSLLEAEDDEGYEVEVVSSADTVFPNIALTLG